jgi:hypothetical protein
MSKALRRLAVALVAVAVACTAARSLQVTFGQNGEGLNGFLCRDSKQNPLLLRLKQADGGFAAGNLVVDFVALQGLPGCRTGQVLDWCTQHSCGPMPGTRVCIPAVQFPDVTGMTRPQMRAAIYSALNAVADSGTQIVSQVPNDPVLVRIVATTESCDAVNNTDSTGNYTAFVDTALFGCAYSCPVQLDSVSGGQVYLDFDTLDETCEQGVRACASTNLNWQPPGADAGC